MPGMIPYLVDVAIPALVVFMMVVVGLDLTPDDFRRVRFSARAVLAGTLGQLVLLPLIAGLLIIVLRPSQTTTVAFCSDLATTTGVVALGRPGALTACPDPRAVALGLFDAANCLRAAFLNRCVPTSSAI